MTQAVLTLQGLDVGWESRIHEALGGYATAEGRVHIPVDYGASLRVSLARGADTLDEQIRDAVAKYGRVTVIGHSRGATVCGVWMDRHGRRNPVDRLDFILLGNPNRKYGGDGIGQRTPTDTPYPVRDIARRWDGWANNDNWPDPITFLSWLRLKLGKLGKTGPHADYRDVALDACKVRATEGNTVFLVHD